MHFFSKIADLQLYLNNLPKKGKGIGFVPTMGALHKGHIELIKKAKNENEIVVCSIFVNPTQFNDPEDLKKYPRTIEEDKKLLLQANCDIVFAPTVDEIYPKPDKRIFSFGKLENTMEGAHRPGHFNGVAQVVSKLFAIVNPTKAYFGEKDYQQLLIVKDLVKQLHLNIDIVGCDIIRETDGLAMSSRNTRLNEKERALAPKIYATLKGLRDYATKEKDSKELKEYVVNEISKEKEMQLEYIEIADKNTLEPITTMAMLNNARAFIAVKLGRVRLIDNIAI